MQLQLQPVAHAACMAAASDAAPSCVCSRLLLGVGDRRTAPCAVARQTSLVATKAHPSMPLGAGVQMSLSRKSWHMTPFPQLREVDMYNTVDECIKVCTAAVFVCGWCMWAGGRAAALPAQLAHHAAAVRPLRLQMVVANKTDLVRGNKAASRHAQRLPCGCGPAGVDELALLHQQHAFFACPVSAAGGAARGVYGCRGAVCARARLPVCGDERQGQRGGGAGV